MDQAEIPCMIKNQRSAMLGGEVPFVEVFPELWVLRNEDFEKAETLLKDWEEAQPLETTSWTCSSCGEIHQKEFTTCWKCSQERNSGNKIIAEEVEHFKEDSDLNVFNHYFFQGLILGIVLSWSCLSAWEYYSLNQDYRDRNNDGNNDYKETRKNGYLTQDLSDDNFDGFFERQCKYNTSGWPTKCLIDRNKDGETDFIEDYTFGVYSSESFLDLDTGKVRKRAYYKLGAKVREKIDEDGDGNFEKTLHFNVYEDPVVHNP